MNMLTLCTIKYMNRSYFSKARYMTGVDFKILGRTPQACHNFFVKKPKSFENVKINVLCLKETDLFDTCGNETPFCLLIFRSDNTLFKSDYRK